MEMIYVPCKNTLLYIGYLNYAHPYGNTMYLLYSLCLLRIYSNTNVC